MVENLQNNGQPYMTIVEQPQSRGFRFRYACEGTSHGGLPGVNSRKDRKTYPEVKIGNYQGPARITVKLVTDADVPFQHAHELIGKNCKNGICKVELKGDTQMKYTFSNLGILHVTKKKVVDILTERIIESIRLDRMIQHNLSFVEVTTEEKNHALTQAGTQSKSMPLNVVRLCFQAYLQDSNGTFSVVLPPVLSGPIYDCKSPGAAALKICRMDKHAGCCRGQDEVFLLCDKVQKDDIAVRFYEEDAEGVISWEGYGSFGPADVHRQYAIVFKTPEYKNPEIQKSVSVQVQLKRISDGETSDPKPFTYYPELQDQEGVVKKRKKNIFPFGGSGGHYGGTGNGRGGNMSNGTWSINSNYTQGSAPPHNDHSLGNVGNGEGGGVSDNLQFYMWPPAEVKAEPMEYKVKPDFNFFQSRGDSSGSSLGLHSELVTDSASVSMDAPHKITSPPKEPENKSNAPPKHSQSDPNMMSRGNERAAKDKDSGFEQRSTSVGRGGKVDKMAGEQGRLDSCYFSGNLESGIGLDEDVPEEEEVQEEGAAGGAVKTVEEKEDVEESEKEKSEQEEKEEAEGGKEEEEEEQEVLVVPDSEVGGRIQQYRQELLRMRTNSNSLNQLLHQIAERSLGALQEYAISGDIEAVLKVYRHLVGAQDDNGDNTLHLAVIHKRTAALRHLLVILATIPDCQAINMYNDLRQTPLHLAALTNEPEMCELLLSQDADFDLADRHGNTPIHLAAMSGYAAVLAKLLSKPKQDCSWPTPFPNINALNYDGLSALHLAAMQGHLACLTHLLKVNANVNLCDGKSGYTALHHAVEGKSIAVAGHLLLEGNAEPNIPCFAGNTPLHLAVGLDHIGMAALLVAARADPHLENAEYVRYTDSEDEEEEGEEAQGAESGEAEPKDDKSKETKKEEEEKEEEGLSPMDMAAGNNRMMKVLMGQAYTSRQDDTLSVLSASFRDSGLGLTGDGRSASGDSGSGILVGDLDFLTLSKLSKVLDHSNAWAELAERLGLSTLIPGLKARSTQTSPSKALLDSFEALQGTVQHLQSALEKLGQKDAVTLLEKAKEEAQKRPSRSLEQ